MAKSNEGKRRFPDIQEVLRMNDEDFSKMDVSDLTYALQGASQDDREAVYYRLNMGVIEIKVKDIIRKELAARGL